MNPYIGELVLFAGNFAPRSWAFCNGQLLAISQYQALFSLLGTIYGGDGRTTFALPDLRGRVPVQQGTGPGLSTHRQGSRGGSEANTLTVNQMPNHSHTLVGSSNVADQKGAAGHFLPSNGRQQTENLYAAEVGTPAAMGSSIGSVGSGESIDNMAPYTGVNYIIALEGDYPSRS